jgi:hypothetical protein
MSASLTVATNDEITDIIPQDSQLCSTSTTQSDVLAGMDFNLPSSQELNHIMNTVLSPRMSSTDIFKGNTFDRCTINLNIKH